MSDIGDVSAYEKLRQDNIARNRGLLASLGIQQHALAQSASVPQAYCKKRKAPAPAPDIDANLFVRRSTRNLGKDQPDYREDSAPVAVSRFVLGGKAPVLRPLACFPKPVCCFFLFSTLKIKITCTFLFITSMRLLTTGSLKLVLHRKNF
jgi:hypothetical protein